MCVTRLLCALMLLAGATPASAEPPGGGNSTLPQCITLVGHDGAGHPDPAGRFQIVIRDLANNPVPGATVMVDFTGCSDVRVCADQLQPGIVTLCGPGGPFVSTTTDANGVASMIIMGGGRPGLGTPGEYAHAYADGVLLGSPRISMFDLDGMNGVGAGDLSLWLSDFGSGLDWVRSDYDCSGSMGAGDLSFWLTAYGNGHNVASCNAATSGACP